MSKSEQSSGSPQRVKSAEEIAEAINQIAEAIVKANPDAESLALLGILNRGKPLAERIAAAIGKATGVTPQTGALATTLYRDDLRSSTGKLKFGTQETHFDFDVDGRTIILVDDVLAAGRTIRAAMDEVMDYGRPEKIQLACLTDRGGRELPIQPDYLAWTLSPKPEEYVAVRLTETDDEDVVLIEQKK